MGTPGRVLAEIELELLLLLELLRLKLLAAGRVVAAVGEAAALLLELLLGRLLEVLVEGGHGCGVRCAFSRVGLISLWRLQLWRSRRRLLEIAGALL